MAGATAVQVGTACFRDPMVFSRVTGELAGFCRREGVERGEAHREDRLVVGGELLGGVSLHPAGGQVLAQLVAKLLDQMGLGADHHHRPPGLRERVGPTGGPPVSVHDVPDAAGLVEAVREFLEKDVMAATEGRVQFHTRVAINVLVDVDGATVLRTSVGQRRRGS